MTSPSVTTGFAALARETRLKTVCMLARAGDAGMLSGEIGEALDIRPNTTSTNLGILLSAGLIRNRREGRTVRYFANPDGLRRLAAVLESCVDGNGARAEELARGPAHLRSVSERTG